MKYLEGGSTGAAEQGGLKVEATEADLVTRRRCDDRRAIFDSDEGERRRSGLGPIFGGVALALRN